MWLDQKYFPHFLGYSLHMMNAMKCEICNKNLGLDLRWVLTDENQNCLMEGPNGIPEIDIKEGTVIGYYCSEQHAHEACNMYLSSVKAEATWSSVRSIEDCGICKASFNTNTWHKVLALSQERGHESDPELIDIEYVTRFCPTCIPSD